MKSIAKFGMLAIFSALTSLFLSTGCSNNPAATAPVTVTQPVTQLATPNPAVGAVWHLALADNASPSSSQFPQRYGFETVVYNGALWIVGGGGNSNNLNDVWTSTDGVHWTNLLADNASPGPGQFSRRTNHCTVSYNGALWVIGGYTGTAALNDVWKSTDGVHWTNVLADNASPPSTQFPERYTSSCLVYNGALWLLGGYAGGPLNDVWTS